MAFYGKILSFLAIIDPNSFQIRLDFNTFLISGPSTSTDSIGKTTSGVLSAAGALAVSTATQCLTDTFTISGATSVPVICGNNNGQHGKLFNCFPTGQGGTTNFAGHVFL